MSDRRAYLTDKKRIARKAARKAGRCIICTHNAATEGLVTCQGCRDRNTAMRRAKREREVVPV